MGNPSNSGGWRLPPRLRRGDKIAVVAPSGPVPRGALEAGLAELERLGLRPGWDESLLERWLFYAGSDHRRRAEFERAFSDPDASGVIAARGGGGAARLLPLSFLDQLDGRPRVFS